jgi:hypothetical protein
MLNAAGVLTTSANPSTPAMAMTKATGMLHISSSNSRPHPARPSCTGVMAP